MNNPEQAMLVYARLASVASAKGQLIGRDRFLVLAGIAATHAGWPDVAERCRRIVTDHAPRHIVNHYATFADALRDEDFAPFARQTEKFCPVERAEYLLVEMGISLTADGEQTAGETATSILASL